MFKFTAIAIIAFQALSVSAQQPPNSVTKDFFKDQPGKQFTTGPCKIDSDCQSSCCGQNNLKCRNPEAFQSDAEFCSNGLTIDFAARNSGKGTFFVVSPKFTGPNPFQNGQISGNTQSNNQANQNNNQNQGNQNNNQAVQTVTVTKTIDCQATPLANNNGNQNNQPQVQNSSQCPPGSSFAVSPQCHDAKTSTSPLGGPQFALFDNRCKGTGFTTSKSTKDEQCCTGCSDGLLCRAPDSLKGVQTCRDGTAPDFSSGTVKFVKKSVSPASCGGANFSKPECGGVKGGV
ncbi:hypothetical protein HK103_001059 [Boothiomyces macroporosus]|uniref:Uncharacterized protein n=1 Tax=Boothiomyces macroporosus TaxID=261099 RepID=A0AAD5UAU5_9FUNG|nr:hypothetical protein HK103_001059 [Boothiomyces macroporosus]